ncbi:MAG: 4-(cytidine 5'-diphospho)-2-C-methyl-D-erythritol kinase [Rhodospirillaceae bacterium]|jgi:4-diphosphocytidyl-2-C-methyl-D-erythritol kinase
MAIVVDKEARAKINLSLLVTGRKSDGYHTLDSIIFFVSFCDRLSYRIDKEVSLDISGPFGDPLGNGRNNLIIQAAEAFKNKCQLNTGVAITLEKNIPVSAGLGGGSANAAMTLLALNELYQTGLSFASLAEIGLTIGADVPVCLFGETARVQGIGEKIQPFDFPHKFGVVLVNPRIPISTARVFSRFNSDFSEVMSTDTLSELSEMQNFSSFKMLKNDLELPATQLCPEISEVLAALRSEDDCIVAGLSGSGPTCFGLFQTCEEAERVVGRLRKWNTNWWLEATANNY